MENLTQHFSHQPILLAILAIALLTALGSIPYFLKQNRLYGTYFEFASTSKKWVTAASFLLAAGITLYALSPYKPPASDEIAIVIGNTQNTPGIRISQDISDAIESTMLQHKGESAEELVDSVRIISAVKHPEVIALDAQGLKLRDIGNNNANAKRSAKLNAQAIIEKISILPPSDNGANYLEAILEARNNLQEGAKIIVVGSGLSDSGDVNFSKTNILTNESIRKSLIREVAQKYGYNYLDGYDITFYGLGDTTTPQEPLSNLQKQTVRSVYQNIVQSIGGDADIKTRTLVGSAVNTDYVVGTTDTGCGDIGLIFDDDNLKFISNKATFAQDTAAKESLMSIKTMWDTYSDTIQTIQVDGYIAHYAGPDNLSQQRADLVKQVLVDMGVPADKISATGRGFGPYEKDVQNRIVKVTISRDSDQCSN